MASSKIIIPSIGQILLSLVVRPGSSRLQLLGESPKGTCPWGYRTSEIPMLDGTLVIRDGNLGKTTSEVQVGYVGSPMACSMERRA